MVKILVQAGGSLVLPKILGLQNMEEIRNVIRVPLPMETGRERKTVRVTQVNLAVGGGLGDSINHNPQKNTTAKVPIQNMAVQSKAQQVPMTSSHLELREKPSQMKVLKTLC